MSEYTKYATNAADQYVSALAEMQDTYLKSLTPFNQWASKLPQMPASSVSPELPTMAEIAEAQFTFANKVLKQQKKFAEKLFSSATPES